MQASVLAFALRSKGYNKDKKALPNKRAVPRRLPLQRASQCALTRSP